MPNNKPAYNDLQKRIQELELLLDENSSELVDEQNELARERKELFKESQRIAKIGSWHLNLMTEELYWSDQSYALFDKELDFIPSFNEFARLVHPDDSDIMQTRFIKALTDPNSSYHVIVRIVNDSEREWIMEAFGAVKRDIDGNPIYIAGTAQDVTERKWVEELEEKNRELEKAKKAAEEDDERLKFVLEGSKLGYWDWDLKTNVVKRNERWAAMLGYTLSEIEFTVNQWTDLIHPDDRELALLSLNNHLKGLSPQHQAEYRMLTKDNRWKWIYDTAKVVKKDENDKPIRMSGTHTDITKRKHSEEKILQYTHELKELNATKDKFFTIIAHDLRNPFNVILGLSELLHKDGMAYLPQKIQEIGELLYESSQHAYNLLNGLLDWSRLQMGNIKPKFTEILPANGIEEVINLCEPNANTKNIQLIAKINVNEQVYTDFNMLKTILRNLVSNAIKFTQPFGIVSIETQNYQNQLCFIVADTGVGIKREHLDKLFKIDNKLSETGTANETGTGLGLVLCSEFVKKLNGKIWVESEYGKGSKFYFTIPKKSMR